MPYGQTAVTCGASPRTAWNPSTAKIVASTAGRTAARASSTFNRPRGLRNHSSRSTIRRSIAQSPPGWRRIRETITRPEAGAHRAGAVARRGVVSAASRGGRSYVSGRMQDVCADLDPQPRGVTR
ncbi:hypothetical protein Sar04_02460 [Salinispora arenicola]|uniref:Uncharacterized protein n=1 Tax=Salinispora arenicola TaxID=168697 RepID=A0ABQ4JKI5_SALAC|nr:hypothetical protein Sar04_02460 [Salinispora arenicola]